MIISDANLCCSGSVVWESSTEMMNTLRELSKGIPVSWKLTDFLRKLICVQKVQVMQARNSVERQLLLVKVKADVSEREGLMRLVDIFKAKVLDVTKHSMVLQITGDNDKIDALMSLLEDYGILELVRTGVVALERGDGVMTSDIFE